MCQMRIPAILSMAILLLGAVPPAAGSPLSWSSLTIDTTAGTIVADGIELVSAGFCTLTDVPSSVAGYAGVAKYTLSASYLTAYDGIMVNASPVLSGARGLALVVPGDIIINAAWNQNGGAAGYTGTSGVPTFGAAGPAGGFRGGDSEYIYVGNRGEGPGGGGTGGSERWSGSGGSLVSFGGIGGGSEGVFRAAAFDAVPPPQPGKSADPAADLWGGSGGGGVNAVDGGRFAGGGGGGGVVGFFSSDVRGSIEVTSSGSIRVEGGMAYGNNYGCGGGGSGGTIILASGAGGDVILDGPVSANGGRGGLHTTGQAGLRSGGGGAGGEIAVYYGTGLFEDVTPTVKGGGDASNQAATIWGADGHYYTEALPPPPALFHPGDANGDGVVDLQDFGALKDHFGLTEGATWATGDFNADGGIDLQDFGVLKDHFGHSAGDTPLAAVPEPGSAILLLSGIGAALRRRGR